MDVQDIATSDQGREFCNKNVHISVLGGVLKKAIRLESGGQIPPPFDVT